MIPVTFDEWVLLSEVTNLEPKETGVRTAKRKTIVARIFSFKSSVRIF